MPKPKQHITVFEHQKLKVGVGEKQLSGDQLKALQSYYGEGVPYFSLIHNGVQFNQFVGVIQVGNTLIEVLPKADKYKAEDTWRDILIAMLRAVSGFEIKSTSNANLKIKPNTILDLYFELFIREVEYLLHKGLIKKYHKTEGNTLALKGNILFAKHIQHNLTHQERFYTRFTSYDALHPLNQILYKTLLLLKRINTNSALHGRLAFLLLNFPELPDIKVSEAAFNKLVFNRKSLAYKKAIEIAKLLLLHYHPDVKKGKNDVLALMFDMNKLWEQFVLVSLRKNKDMQVKGQQEKYFWKPEDGNRRTVRPDILVKYKEQDYILDTKWKNIDTKPSLEDVRQMYVYHQYFSAKKVALFYPGSHEHIKGQFVDIHKQKEVTNLECGLLFTEPDDKVKEWQTKIATTILKWINPS